jgi:hypothetical protein
MPGSVFSRRDFFKLSGASLLAFLFSGLKQDKTAAAVLRMQGRVVYNSLIVRNEPDFTGRKVRSYPLDTILEISEQIQGGTASDYNRTWYRLGGDGFVYSGGVQPVRNELNETVTSIDEKGMLGEITVPIANSAWGINRSPSAGPRLYYASTHWITALVTDAMDGSLWYKAFDNLNNSHYYIRPDAVRIYKAAELAAISSEVSATDKLIQISLDRQLLVAFEKNEPVFAARVATGQPNYETPTGIFHTFHKRPTYHMTGGADATTMFDLPGVPWDSYFTGEGAAMHGTYWHNDFGHPHSHGCVNMTPQDARWIFRWTIPCVPANERLVLKPGEGTRVVISQA